MIETTVSYVIDLAGTQQEVRVISGTAYKGVSLILDLRTMTATQCVNLFGDCVEIPWPEGIPKEYTDIHNYLSTIGQWVESVVVKMLD